MAAAIYVTSFFVIGSTVGSFIDRLWVDSLAPLATGYLIVGLITVVLAYTGRTRAAVDAAANPILTTSPMNQLEWLVAQNNCNHKHVGHSAFH